MTLYYHKDNYEIKDLSDELVNGWIVNNNPKKEVWILLPQQPSPNHYWSNGQWILAQVAVPESISARQIRLWLVNNGISLDQIDSAINNIADPLVRQNVKIEWEYAPYVERSHPWLESLALSLGLTNENVDNAFIEASIL